MVILIGGVSCTGKTLLAQRLLENYHIPYLSIDHIKMGMYRGLKNCGFSPLDSDLELTKNLWPVVRGIIMTNIENKQNIIIEGCYIPANYEQDFSYEYLQHIIAFFIGFSERYIIEHYSDCIVKYANSIESRLTTSHLSIDELISEHARLKDDCLGSCVKHFLIDSDYEAVISEVYTWLDKQIANIISANQLAEHTYC